MPNLTTHDHIMLGALAGVNFGIFNQSAAFVSDVKANGIQTARQRWWLTTLVVRHRRQVKNQAAIATAERWLRENQEPTPDGTGGDMPVEEEPPPPAPAPVPPTLFDLPSNEAWCIIDATTYPAVLRCRRCGMSIPIQLPMDPLELAAANAAFIKDHKHQLAA